MVLRRYGTKVFGAVFRISVWTVEACEPGCGKLDGATRVMLRVIGREAEAVRTFLGVIRIMRT